MSGQVSEPDTLTLHAVRLLGYGETQRIAGRFDQDPLEVEERLLDFESVGWVSRSSFADSSGWSLTDRGRSEDERRLSDELDERGARAVVVDVHARFLPINGRFQEVATRWQIRPMPGDPMAANDHSDHRWDDQVLDSLASVARRLAPLVEELAGELTRFADYSPRFDGRGKGHAWGALLGRRRGDGLVPHRVDAAPRGPARHLGPGSRTRAGVTPTTHALPGRCQRVAMPATRLMVLARTTAPKT